MVLIILALEHTSYNKLKIVIIYNETHFVHYSDVHYSSRSSGS